MKFWGWKDALGGEKISPMEIPHVTWFDIRVFNIVCPADGNARNKRF